ncbi:hypothetical protein NBO_80g0018 [Nosema bombycis CQ1]|uniref:Mechanosensitive ion channel MscS domain-containing protein n=1 Tax=Nosema bombycis (strain CQ1 / CVCC 102059) TaxID=578461 RepID=R0MGW2_NOSB1|nr:hypothetical protein NBO_80g0018 [Nosema bombycis CQ1]|eukprot:EOB13355.1 hypothetical protein NBO_80g0018 [Nosema bombycis CQ1]
MDDAFNWFESELEIETEDFNTERRPKTTFSMIYDFICIRANQLFPIFFIARVVWWVFGLSDTEMLGVRITTFLTSLSVSFGSLVVINVAMKTTTYILLNLSKDSDFEPFLGLYRLYSTMIWCVVNVYWLDFIKCAILYNYKVYKNIFIAGLITLIAYTISGILMIYFDRYFLTKTLNDKLREVEKTERLLSVMKSFRYEIYSSDSIGTPQCSCTDIFCLGDIDVFEEGGSNRRGLEEIDSKVSYLSVSHPELHSVPDAKTLARDVFYKASSDGDTLSFDDFSSIFPSTQVAINAYIYFDNGEDKKITKKTFHDTIIQFYMERVNLEKSIYRAEDFVNVVSNIFNIIILIILFLIYLVIFGIPLKELLALALSSALALNFIASGMAGDLYNNFMMLLSHQFDIGDEVIVDGVEYKVYEFGLTSTSLIGENGGKIKFLNSDMWKKTLVNMTRAPEKILVFKFQLNPNIDNRTFFHFKNRIYNFVQHKKFDFYDTFSLHSNSEGCTGLDFLNCVLVLKCKTFKNKAKKFTLRVEMTNWLRNTIEDMNIGI